jgi:hypothetical protein
VTVDEGVSFIERALAAMNGASVVRVTFSRQESGRWLVEAINIDQSCACYSDENSTGDTLLATVEIAVANVVGQLGGGAYDLPALLTEGNTLLGR